MARLVVFMGGSRDIVTSTQRALAPALAGLAAQGVLVPRAGRTTIDDTAISHQALLAETDADQAWRALGDELAHSDAECVLLLLPGLARPGEIEELHREAVERLLAVTSDVRLVTVVTDQLTLMNEAYLALVGAWRTTARLTDLLPQMLESGLFDHQSMLGPWLDEMRLSFTAVRRDALRRADPIGELLGAAGVAVTGPTGSAQATEPPLGPIAVEANRLLTGYLRASLPGLTPADPSVVELVAGVAERALRNGWSDVAFWGFDPRTAAETAARFDEGNARFARAAWDADWPSAAPVDRPCTAVDLLDLEPSVVEQIHRYVVSMTDRLTKGTTR